MNSTLIVRGARVLDPLAPEPRPAVRDIAISGDRITAVEEDVPVPPSAKVVEAKVADLVGAATEELPPGKLDIKEESYPVIVAVRATRAAA